MSDKLKLYEAAQIEAIEQSKPRFLQRGHLADHGDLYPDVLRPKDGAAYARGLNPLPFLLMMYEHVTLHVPPFEQSVLEARYGLSLDSIEELCQVGLVQPIISNPSDYTAPHLERFLTLQAPSVWARGVHALLALDMGWSLDIERCPLPVREMAQSPILRSRFANRYASLSTEELGDRIVADILVNYADLCIFGHRELADGLVDYKDAGKIVEVLYLLSEVLTYPFLFGFGGTANYDEFSVKVDPEFIPLNLDNFQRSGVPLDQKELEFFARSISLKTHSLTQREIIDFHASNDGKRLRNAVRKFEEQARALQAFALQSGGPQGFTDEAEILREQLLDSAKLLSSPEFIRKTRRRENIIEITLQCGTIAAGAFLGQHMFGPIGFLGGLGGTAILDRVLLPKIREKITAPVRTALLGPGLANLWRLGNKK